MNLSRRGIIGGLICSPAIVRATSLMVVKNYVLPVTATEIVETEALFIKNFSRLVNAAYARPTIYQTLARRRSMLIAPRDVLLK